jgi:hypothetical protein
VICGSTTASTSITPAKDEKQMPETDTTERAHLDRLPAAHHSPIKISQGDAYTTISKRTKINPFIASTRVKRSTGRSPTKRPDSFLAPAAEHQRNHQAHYQGKLSLAA